MDDMQKNISYVKELNVKLIGIDDWSRPVYKDEKGRLYKDVNLGRGLIRLCTSYNNDFYGEPDININEDIKINIVKSFKKERER